MSEKFCEKHRIHKENLGSGGWTEMHCLKCDEEARIAYNAPGEANKRTRRKAEQRKRARQMDLLRSQP